jgi:DUF4097 and DUF4098 domain-containing protein YvlB
MKRFPLQAVTAVVLTFGAGLAVGQTKSEPIVVPLSRPGEPMSLRIDILSARIEVVGEERKDAEFVITMSGTDRKIVTPSGAKAIAGGSYEVEVKERDNVISIDAEGRPTRMDVVAKIPRRANLKLSTTNNGEIIVRSITGNLELENTNGPITATNVNGSVIAESVNRPITVAFSGISDVTSLSSLNGNIELSLPAAARAELRIDSARGEIVSDFELDLKPGKPVIERKEGRGGVSVRVEDVVVATINGGGPVIRLKTLNGNIRIGKAPK